MSSSCADKPAPGSQSAFLQCLSKLNDDTFCQILLPKLKADASAGSLAATCSQLRRLCHNSIERLDMSPLINNHAPSAAEQWTQGLQEHFPHCSSVVLCVQEMRGYHGVNYVLPALARCVQQSTSQAPCSSSTEPAVVASRVLQLGDWCAGHPAAITITASLRGEPNHIQACAPTFKPALWCFPVLWTLLTGCPSCRAWNSKLKDHCFHICCIWPCCCSAYAHS